MDAVLAWQQVTKRFGRQRALDDISLTVPPGVVFALLGENGAGKTTAIRVSLGLLAPDSGSAHVLGLDSQRDDLQIRQRVGYVAEQPALYDWMTVEEMGWFAAGFYGGTYLAEYQTLARQFNLPMGQQIKSLSKGMRAKVSLSLALANDPELLILDEPTSGLDPLVRREFLERMVDRAAAGKSVLLSSHQITEVERVADHVAILHEGQIALVASLDELKTNIQELTVTLSEENHVPPAVTGVILRQQQRARQWQLLVRGAPDAPGYLLRQPGVTDVEARTPTLEEVFVAYVAPSEQHTSPSPTQEELTP